MRRNNRKKQYKDKEHTKWKAKHKIESTNALQTDKDSQKVLLKMGEFVARNM